MEPPPGEQLVGQAVDPNPAKVPKKVTLGGRLVDLVPIDPAFHGDSLFEGTFGARESIWRYVTKGHSLTASRSTNT